ncbi:MAG: glycerol-3-phosphate 1-O-acyltransferase PlsY [Flavobacteriia bacterium]|nr:glycerol-3-phosphate 1-O-acyltransferase PlsY [Flavobacteriia bacterium]OJX34841.1 MAG: acyl-phosphate glycerol 3-phosphate acyltransferase [Flavobacteriia bacterium 40-80]
MEAFNLIYVLLAYLLGSLPTAVWVGKRFYGLDVREHGSKNAGATNTFRVLGKKPGIFVLAIDVIKGFLAVSIMTWNTQYLGEDEQSYFQIAAAIAAVVGHMFPVFAQFKGGKGVATSLGVILGLYPAAAGVCVVVFLAVFIASQYVSLGAIVAAFIFPLMVNFIFESSFWLKAFSWVLAALVIYKHKLNISRLLAGNENKMNLFRKSS